jgi:hypothetical protein
MCHNIVHKFVSDFRIEGMGAAIHSYLCSKFVLLEHYEKNLAFQFSFILDNFINFTNECKVLSSVYLHKYLNKKKWCINGLC